MEGGSNLCFITLIERVEAQVFVVAGKTDMDDLFDLLIVDLKMNA